MATSVEYYTNPEAYSCGIDHVILPPERQIGQHSQDTWELAYVVKGAGVRTIGSTTEPFEPGEIVLIPPRIPHCWNFDVNHVDADGNIENYSLTFHDTLLQRAAAFPELREPIERLRNLREAILIPSSLTSEVASLLAYMTLRQDAELSLSLLRLLVLLGNLHEGRVVGKCQILTPAEQRLNRLRIFISCNFDRDIRLDDAANHLGMNRSAFCVFLKKTTGQTFTALLNEYRVRMACRLLREKPDSAVAEIAWQTGFNTICYFNRVFLRMVGMSPVAFRSSGR